MKNHPDTAKYIPSPNQHALCLGPNLRNSNPVVVTKKEHAVADPITEPPRHSNVEHVTNKSLAVSGFQTSAAASDFASPILAALLRDPEKLGRIVDGLRYTRRCGQ